MWKFSARPYLVKISRKSRPENSRLSPGRGEFSGLAGESDKKTFLVGDFIFPNVGKEGVTHNHTEDMWVTPKKCKRLLKYGIKVSVCQEGIIVYALFTIVLRIKNFVLLTRFD